MKIQVINTSDGSKTLYIPDMDEQYHSVNGAFTESNHVFIESGYNFHRCQKPTIFEVGFGTGLNCLLTAIAAEESKRPTTFISIEKYPVEMDKLYRLDYGNYISTEGNKIYEKIHSCTWNEEVEITSNFKLIKMNTDLKTMDFSLVKKCDIIYFDAFGPDKQPSMWQPEILRNIYSITNKEGVFVTYSAKGEVRRNLMDCGYEMERIPGPPGKKQMLRGIKRD